MKYLKLFLLVLSIMAGLGFYIINQPKKSIANKNADYVMSPQHLLAEYETDETAANKKFLDKIISVEGRISSISADTAGVTTVMIDTENPMSSISCQIDKTASYPQNLQEHQIIKVKGICTGVLMDVVLVDCVVEN